MKKLILFALLFIFTIVGYFAWNFYNAIAAPNTNFSEATRTVDIPTNTTYNKLTNILLNQNIIKDLGSFNQTSTLMKYDKAKIKSGRYLVQKDWSNRSLISSLRLGKQTPVKLSFNNVRTIESLAGKLSHIIEPDSMLLLNYFTDSKTLSMYNLKRETVLSHFIPNTYEVYWNISPEKFMLKMKKEFDKFWSKNDRSSNADKLGFTKEQVATLASIVEKETQANIEKPRIAGVYINRLNRGIPLQADPTVVFAQNKFDIKRVLLKHLEIDSPYNTYKYAGLPPGPIYMPSISSIDAVLDPEQHKYIYFCAKPDGSGQHAFAKTLTEHNRNAKIYQRWLSKNRIH